MDKSEKHVIDLGNESGYIVAIAMANDWVREGTMSPSDYSNYCTKMAAKYQPSLCNI